MARTVAIGIQSFDEIRQKNCFYIDKAAFIREWWENNDSVTLITRPRRFGKTLNMSMVEQFFLSIMRDGEICLRGLQTGRMKASESCREPFR